MGIEKKIDGSSDVSGVVQYVLGEADNRDAEPIIGGDKPFNLRVNMGLVDESEIS